MVNCQKNHKKTFSRLLSQVDMKLAKLDRKELKDSNGVIFLRNFWLFDYLLQFLEMLYKNHILDHVWKVCKMLDSADFVLKDSNRSLGIWHVQRDR